jgi:NitT/TauT family transport system ATP-binding protein
MICSQQRKLVVDKVSVSFANSHNKSELRVLDKIAFIANDGEFICFVGPSGCGKTTLLNILAGFEPVQTGKVFYNGNPVVKPSPERAVVFQSAVLFPWLTVRDNIIYGLKRSGASKAHSVQMVKDYLQMVKMDGFENFYPEQLSGGMQQRVALARALILKPRVLLMDEPFAALDAQTRLTMQELLMDIRQSLTTTVIMVTHDVEEALYLADRVFVMSKRPAKIISEIYVPFEKPRTLSLRGTPAFASLKAEILRLIVEQVK